jgi:hypothetical protein
MALEVASAETTRQQRVEAALGSPAFFGETYVAPYDPGWAETLPRVAREYLLFMMRVRRGVIFTPPETLKTTALQVYALWLTCRYAAFGQLSRLTGMFVSEEQKLAERNLGVVAWHIEQNEIIRGDFVDKAGLPLLEPDADEEKWTDAEIVVRRPGKIKDPTWQAKSGESKGVPGSRIRHMLGDDVITPRSADSPATQEKMLKLWDTQFTPRVYMDGQAVIVGNFNSGRDMLSQLARRSSYAVLRRPTLHVAGDRSKAPDEPSDPSAVLQVPERWSRERLQLDREEKPNRFRRIHLLDEHAEVGERLKTHWVEIIPPEETPVAEAGWILALDPAPGGEGDDLDFFNVTVGAVHGEHFDLAISHDTRDSTGEQAELVAAYFDRFSRVGRGVVAIGIAKVALDRYFGGALKILRPDIASKLVPISISTASKTERLEALGPYAKSGWLRCWQPAWEGLTSATVDRAQELSLMEQWRDFPQIAHDDKLDGLDVGCRTAIEFGYRGQRRKATLKVAKG